MIWRRCKRPLIQKRSYLLFELLIAMTLVMGALIPLLKPHFVMRNQAIEKLIRIQLEPCAQHALCEVKQRLHERRYSWEELDKEVTGSCADVKIKIGKERFLPFLCSYTINKERKKSKTSELLEITLLFTSGEKSYSYSYPLFMTREG